MQQIITEAQLYMDSYTMALPQQLTVRATNEKQANVVASMEEQATAVEMLDPTASAEGEGDELSTHAQQPVYMPLAPRTQSERRRVQI